MIFYKKMKFLLVVFTILIVFTCEMSLAANGSAGFDPFMNPPSSTSNDTTPKTSNSEVVIPQVEFSGNDITMVLQIISDATGWSIFPTQTVSGAKITFSAKNITAQQLLDTIIELTGFIYYRDGNIISIMTYDEYVQYHGLERETFQLNNGNANKVDAAIKPFLSKIGKSIVHEDSNTIILYESAANVEYIKNIIEKLDIPIEQMQTVVHTLKYAKASNISQILSDVFSSLNEDTQQQPKSVNQSRQADRPTSITEDIILQQSNINIFPVEYSNQIVLVGSENMISQVMDLVSVIDVKGNDLTLEVLDLQYVDAVVVEETLQQVFNNNNQNNGQTLTSFASTAASSLNESGDNSGGLLNPEAPIGVYAIGRTNQIIVKAYERDMGIIKILIEKLDTYIEPISKVYNFTYVDVSEVYTGLERIMDIYAGYSSSTGSFSSGGRSGSRAGYGRSGITLIEKSNSILLTAPPSAHRIMESIKSSIDIKSTFESGMIRIYKIENSEVEEIAQNISELLNVQNEDKSKSSGITFRNNTDSNNNGLDLSESGEILSETQTSVSVNASTNSVIVMATARQHREIEQLIMELDKRKKQVLLEAKIVEVTTSDDLDLGVELGYENGGSSIFSFLNLSSNLDPVTANRSVIVSPGATALLNPYNLQVVLHTLQTNGNIRIHSAPQILVNDHEVGYINSVNEEPYTTVTQGETSDRTSFGGFVEAGTQFAVTPHISEDNYLQIEYQITLNSFTGDSSDETIPPPRSTNTIQSKATIPNNYTIVVGGLRTRDEKETVSKVPLLGDIPIVGSLFKNTQTEKTYKTIYLFITPKIMEQEDFADLKNESMKALDDVKSKDKSMIYPEKESKDKE